MPSYLVWPLDTYKHELYSAIAYELREGLKVIAPDAETAAKAIMGTQGEMSIKHFMVQGPDGLEEFNFEPIPGVESFRFDEGPHR